MQKVAILGSTGMLGSTTTKFLSKYFQVIEFNRAGKAVVHGNLASALDITDESSIFNFIQNTEFDFVVNGIGLIKQLINENSPEDVSLAYTVNSSFPAILSDYSEKTSTPVIQIGTDCVYSGKDGDYDELSIFDCTDLYGLSKAKGERLSRSLLTIRCSIVGHELNTCVSLMDWFTSRPNKAQIKGYTNHYWNGVTTLDFAKIIKGVIDSGDFSPGTFHLVPANKVSKYELLNELADSLNRTDITIEPFVDENPINRTLSTLFPDKNSKLWAQAGYDHPPSVKEMVKNYALWSS